MADHSQIMYNIRVHVSDMVLKWAGSNRIDHENMMDRFYQLCNEAQSRHYEDMKYASGSRDTR